MIMSCVDLRIRSFEMERDHQRVVELEKKCEIATNKRPFLITDTLGDPLSRIRNTPLYNMLVAELKNELVGIICGSIKIATTNGGSRRSSLGYILGLRVSHLHQRRGIGSSLVIGLEQWFHDNLVDYVYMATEKSNEASLKLFTYKLGFVAFRAPAILVNPVGNYLIPISSSVEIKKVEISQAECLYRKYMSSTEFFPQDIDGVLRNKLSFGTWLAYPRGENWNLSSSTTISDSPTPRSWAMLSVWNCTMVYKVKVVKAPWTCVAMRKLLNRADKFFPWLRVPVMPNVFSTFGYYFIYGMQAEGPQAELLMSSLCRYVHNMARKNNDCEVIVAEVGGGDVIRSYIPHWKSLSFSEDIWCIKPLQSEKEEAFLDWTTSPPPPTIFFDPRDL